MQGDYKCIKFELFEKKSEPQKRHVSSCHEFGSFSSSYYPLLELKLAARIKNVPNQHLVVVILDIVEHLQSIVGEDVRAISVITIRLLKLLHAMEIDHPLDVNVCLDYMILKIQRKII